MNLDASGLNIHFRGYPVTLVSDGVVRLLGGPASVPVGLRYLLAAAKDTAEPDEPSGWYFEADFDGTAISVERFGGVRSRDSHEGGQWSVFLPGER